MAVQHLCIWEELKDTIVTSRVVSWLTDKACADAVAASFVCVWIVLERMQCETAWSITVPSPARDSVILDALAQPVWCAHPCCLWDVSCSDGI